MKAQLSKAITDKGSGLGWHVCGRLSPDEPLGGCCRETGRLRGSQPSVTSSCHVTTCAGSITMAIYGDGMTRGPESSSLSRSPVMDPDVSPSQHRPDTWSRGSSASSSADRTDLDLEPRCVSSSGSRRAPSSVRILKTAGALSSRMLDDEALKARHQSSCWRQFAHWVCGFWETEDFTSKPGANPEIVKATMRQLMVYTVFLLFICILTFGMTSATTFYYTKNMESLFGNLSQVATVEDFWQFLSGQFLDSLFWDYNYNSDEGVHAFVCPYGQSSTGPCPLAPGDKIVLDSNHLLGTARLRQLRVFNGSCVVHTSVDRYVTKECYSDYMPSNEDTQPFGLASRLGKAGSGLNTSVNAWYFNNSANLNGTGYWGELGWYSGSGSFQDLGSSKDESLRLITELKEGLWIGRGTRFVSLDFTLFNSDLNLFCIIKLVFEFPSIGGVVPSYNFLTTKLLRYVTGYDHFLLACEIIFVLFVLYYSVEEYLEIRRYGLRYFLSMWNCFDSLLIMICYLVIALTLFSIWSVTTNLGNMLANPDQFADFTSLGFWVDVNRNVIAILVFVAWIKILKYVPYNRTMQQLSRTMSKSSTEMMVFSVMFVIIFMAFALLGNVLFGSQMQDYNTLVESTFTLLRIILGDFDFSGMYAVDKYLGPAFFISYVFYVFFYLMSMFLAIINDTYIEVKAQLDSQKHRFAFEDYFSQGYENIVQQLLHPARALQMQAVMDSLQTHQHHLTYEELRQNLKKHNFADLEIEVFVARCDASPRPGGQLPRRTSVVASVAYHSLNQRLDQVDRCICSVLPKLNLIVAKLHTEEATSDRKREALARTFDEFTQDDD